MGLDKKLIGNRIKCERNSLNITQEELAIKLGLSNKSSVSQYEKGDAIPSDDIKLKMCKIFGCSIDFLLGKSDIKNHEKQIDNELNETMLGMSKKEYDQLTEFQKKQIRDFAIYIKSQNEGEKK